MTTKADILALSAADKGEIIKDLVKSLSAKDRRELLSTTAFEGQKQRAGVMQQLLLEMQAWLTAGAYVSGYDNMRSLIISLGSQLKYQQQDITPDIFSTWGATQKSDTLADMKALIAGAGQIKAAITKVGVQAGGMVQADLDALAEALGAHITLAETYQASLNA